MKKTFIFLLGLAFSTSFAQTTITQSTDTTTVASGAVTCGGNDGSYTGFNVISRSFDLASFGITSDFTVTNVGFGTTSLSGDLPFTLRLSTTDAPYPGGNLTELASEEVAISSNEGVILDYAFTTPVVIPANSELVFSFEADGEDNSITWYPASNDLGQSADSYITAPACGADSPVTYESIGYPNAHIIMTITGESEAMGTFEVNSKALAIYPNPATDVINITLKNSETQSVEIVNVAGQIVSSSSAKLGINTQNVSSLAAGVYILRVKDNKGVTHVSKFVKK